MNSRVTYRRIVIMILAAFALLVSMSGTAEAKYRTNANSYRDPNAEPFSLGIETRTEERGNDPMKFSDPDDGLIDPETGIQLGTEGYVESHTTIDAKSGEEALHPRGSCEACDQLREVQAAGGALTFYRVDVNGTIRAKKVEVDKKTGEIVGGERIKVTLNLDHADGQEAPAPNPEPATNEGLKCYTTVCIPVDGITSGDTASVYQCNGSGLADVRSSVSDGSIEFNTNKLEPFAIVQGPDDPLAAYANVIVPDYASTASNNPNVVIPDDDDEPLDWSWLLYVIGGIVALIFIVGLFGPIVEGFVAGLRGVDYRDRRHR